MVARTVVAVVLLVLSGACSTGIDAERVVGEVDVLTDSGSFSILTEDGGSEGFMQPLHWKDVDGTWHEGGEIGCLEQGQTVTVGVANVQLEDDGFTVRIATWLSCA